MSSSEVGYTDSARAEHITGWVRFAGIILTVAGVLQIIHGFTAIDHKSYFTGNIIYHNLTVWGWIFMIWGVLQVIAGTASLTGRMVGNYLGTLLAVCAMFLWFFMIFTAPWAAVLGVGLNMLVVYGLTIGAVDQWE